MDARSPIPHGPDGHQEAPGADGRRGRRLDGGGGGWAQPSGPKTRVGGAGLQGCTTQRRRRLGGTGGSPSGRWRRDGLDGVGDGCGRSPQRSATDTPVHVQGTPLLGTSLHLCPHHAARQPGSIPGSLVQSIAIPPRPSLSGLNFSRFALAIPTPAGTGLGTAKLPRPMPVLWGGDGGGWTAGKFTPSPTRVYRACPRPRAVLSFRLNCTIAVRLMEA